MKLYYIPGACSMGAHIVLREVGGPFELERVDIATKMTEAGKNLRDVNPKGVVPVLETDTGETVTEGPAILQFIADSAGASALAPVPGTVARARVQEVLNFVSAELRNSFGPLFNPALPEDARERQKAVVGKNLDWLETLLSDGRPHLTGEGFTVADAYAYAVTGFTRIHGMGLSAWPRLQAFMARVAARPSVQAAMRAEGLA